MFKNRKKEYIKNCTGPDCKTASTNKRRMFSRFLFYLLFLAFLGTLIYITFFAAYLEITKINIQGNTQLQTAEIEQTLKNSLNGKYLGFIPKNNYLFVLPGRWENSLKDNFKKIKTASVEKKFPDTISVSLEEYSALLVWCAGENCFMIDESGTAYAQADFNSPEITQNNLIRINDVSSQAVKLGSEVIDPAYAAYVLGLRGALAKINVLLADDGYQTPSRMAEEIDVKTQAGAQILFSTQYAQDLAVKALELVLIKQIPTDQQNSIAYIDLRSEGKAFYTISGQEATPPADTSEEKKKM